MTAGTFWHRLRHGAWRTFDTPLWRQLSPMKTARDVWALAVSDRYHTKQGRSTGRVVWRQPGREARFYLKRHLLNARWRACGALLWPKGDWSPAAAEAVRLQWARERGFAVPATLAFGEEIGPGLELRSFLAIAELTGMQEINELLPAAAGSLSPAQFARWKRNLAKQLGELVRRLHAYNRFHKDLYLCHCFFSTSFAPDQGLVHLIDWQRLRWHPITRLYWQVKDLAQLLYSSRLPHVQHSDRLRFFIAYRRRRHRGWWDRVLLRLVTWKAGRYERHNRRAEESPTTSTPQPVRRAS